MSSVREEEVGGEAQAEKVKWVRSKRRKKKEKVYRVHKYKNYTKNRSKRLPEGRSTEGKGK